MSFRDFSLGGEDLGRHQREVKADRAEQREKVERSEKRSHEKGRVYKPAITREQVLAGIVTLEDIYNEPLTSTFLQRDRIKLVREWEKINDVHVVEILDPNTIDPLKIPALLKRMNQEVIKRKNDYFLTSERLHWSFTKHPSIANKQLSSGQLNAMLDSMAFSLVALQDHMALQEQELPPAQMATIKKINQEIIHFQKQLNQQYAHARDVFIQGHRHLAKVMGKKTFGPDDYTAVLEASKVLSQLESLSEGSFHDSDLIVQLKNQFETQFHKVVAKCKLDRTTKDENAMLKRVQKAIDNDEELLFAAASTSIRFKAWFRQLIGNDPMTNQEREQTRNSLENLFTRLQMAIIHGKKFASDRRLSQIVLLRNLGIGNTSPLNEAFQPFETAVEAEKLIKVADEAMKSIYANPHGNNDHLHIQLDDVQKQLKELQTKKGIPGIGTRIRLCLDRISHFYDQVIKPSPFQVEITEKVNQLGEEAHKIITSIEQDDLQRQLEELKVKIKDLNENAEDDSEKQVEELKNQLASLEIRKQKQDILLERLEELKIELEHLLAIKGVPGIEEPIKLYLNVISLFYGEKTPPYTEKDLSTHTDATYKAAQKMGKEINALMNRALSQSNQFASINAEKQLQAAAEAGKKLAELDRFMATFNPDAEEWTNRRMTKAIKTNIYDPLMSNFKDLLAQTRMHELDWGYGRTRVDIAHSVDIVQQTGVLAPLPMFPVTEYGYEHMRMPFESRWSERHLVLDISAAKTRADLDKIWRGNRTKGMKEVSKVLDRMEFSVLYGHLETAEKEMLMASIYNIKRKISQLDPAFYENIRNNSLIAELFEERYEYQSEVLFHIKSFELAQSMREKEPEQAAVIMARSIHGLNQIKLEENVFTLDPRTFRKMNLILLLGISLEKDSPDYTKKMEQVAQLRQNAGVDDVEDLEQIETVFRLDKEEENVLDQVLEFGVVILNDVKLYQSIIKKLGAMAFNADGRLPTIAKNSLMKMKQILSRNSAVQKEVVKDPKVARILKITGDLNEEFDFLIPNEEAEQKEWVHVESPNNQEALAELVLEFEPDNQQPLTLDEDQPPLTLEEGETKRRVSEAGRKRDTANFVDFTPQPAYQRTTEQVPTQRAEMVHPPSAANANVDIDSELTLDVLNSMHRQGPDFPKKPEVWVRDTQSQQEFKVQASNDVPAKSLFEEIPGLIIEGYNALYAQRRAFTLFGDIRIQAEKLRTVAKTNAEKSLVQELEKIVAKIDGFEQRLKIQEGWDKEWRQKHSSYLQRNVNYYTKNEEANQFFVLETQLLEEIEKSQNNEYAFTNIYIGKILQIIANSENLNNKRTAVELLKRRTEFENKNRKDVMFIDVVPEFLQELQKNQTPSARMIDLVSLNEQEIALLKRNVNKEELDKLEAQQLAELSLLLNKAMLDIVYGRNKSKNDLMNLVDQILFHLKDNPYFKHPLYPQVPKLYNSLK